MSLSHVIESDLRALSQQARRRFPSVKEAAERGLLLIRSLASRDQDPVDGLRGASKELVQPFVLACRTNDVQLVTAGVSSLQKMVSHGAVQLEFIPSIIVEVDALVDTSNDTVQLKALQLMVTLLTSCDVHDTTLLQALHLCFRLYQRPQCSDPVKNTASASLRQVITMLVDQAGAAVSQPSGSGDTLTQVQTDALRLLTDIVALTSEEPPQWLSLSSLDKNFAFELMETAMSHNPQLFQQIPAYMCLLKDRIFPLIIKHFRTENRFCFVIRLVRLMKSFVQHFHAQCVAETEVFVSKLIRLLEPDRPLWLRAVVLEVFSEWCADASLLRHMYRAYDMPRTAASSSSVTEDPASVASDSGCLFAALARSLGRFAQSMFAWADSDMGRSHVSLASKSTLSGHDTAHSGGSGTAAIGGGASGGVGSPAGVRRTSGGWRRATHRPVRLMNMLSTSVAPAHVNRPYVASLIADALCHLVDALAALASATTAAGATEGQEEEQDDDEGETAAQAYDDATASTTDTAQDAMAMAASSWPAVLGGLSLLVAKTSDEELAHQVFMCHQSFIMTCGSAGLTTPREAFITSLQKHALPDCLATDPLSDPATTSFGRSIMGNSTGADGSGGASPGGVGSGDVGGGSGVSGGGGIGMGISGGGSGGSGLSGSGNALMSPHADSDGWIIMVDPSCGLTAKHVLGLKVMLNVAHGMGSVLGSSWLLVVETLHRLDYCLWSNPSLRRALQPSDWAPFGAAGTPGAVLGAVAEPTEARSGGMPRRSSSGGDWDVGGGGGGAPNTSSDALDPSVMNDDREAEAMIMATALASVFASGSLRLCDQALHDLGTALCMLSTRSAALPASASLRYRTWPAARLVETASANMHRLAAMWTMVESHLLMLCRHEDSEVRCFAARGLAALVLQALERDRHASDSGVAMLGALERVLAEHSQADTAQVVLDAVYHMLQGAGQSLQSNVWQQVFSLLAQPAVCASPLAGTAFQGVRLVVTDFLPSVPWSCMSRLLDLCAEYVGKAPDMNVSLTAIGMVWDISDYLAKVAKGQHSAAGATSDGGGDGGDGDCDGGSSGDGSVGGATDTGVSLEGEEEVGDLLLLSYPVMKGMCCDGRPEIRHSALRTLFKTLMLHGPDLDVSRWRHILESVIEPLLGAVQNGATSGKRSGLGGSAAAGGTLLGRQQGRDVSMLIHHSRDTAAKQWQETVVLTMQGVTRVMKAFFANLLCTQDSLQTTWARLLAFIHDRGPGAAEVAEAGFTCLHRLLSAFHSMPASTTIGADPLLTQLWNACWHEMAHLCESVLRGSVAAAAAASAVAAAAAADTTSAADVGVASPTSANALSRSYAREHSQPLLTAFAASIEASLSSLRSLMSADNVATCITMLGQLMGGNPPYGQELSPCQEHIVSALHTMLPLAYSELYPLYVATLCYGVSLPVCLGTGAFSGPGDAPTRVSVQALQATSWSDAEHGVRRTSLDTTLVAQAVRCLQLLASAWEAHVSPQQRAHMWYPVVHTLRRAIMVKYHVYACVLWTAGVEAVEALVPHALCHLGIIEWPTAAHGIVGPWNELIDVMEAFLMHESPHTGKVSPAVRSRDEALDHCLVQLVSRHLIRTCPAEPASLHARLVSLLLMGCTMSSLNREQFALSSYSSLFDLCEVDDAQGEAGIDVARAVAPILLKHCSQVMSQYVEDDAEAGACPLPRHRAAEVRHVLTLLHGLRLHPSVLPPPPQGPPSGTSGYKRHLLALYRVISQCVSVRREDGVTDILVRILLVVADELQLQ